jgi:hypothetical protein
MLQHRARCEAVLRHAQGVKNQGEEEAVTPQCEESKKRGVTEGVQAATLPRALE